MTRLFIPICLLLAACGANLPAPVPVSVSDFEVLTKGEPIDLDAHAQAGKVTVFDFYADWCPPCKLLDKSLVGLKQTYGDRLVIYKLDIIDWKSPLAQQQGIADLPYLVVYDSQQKQLAGGPSNQVLPQLIALLNR